MRHKSNVFIEGNLIVRKPAVWKHYTAWTAQDKIYLIANHDKMELKHIALHLGRSYYATKKMLQDLQYVTTKQLKAYVDNSLKNSL